ncbi:TatD family hydrolase [Actinomycetospora sp. TBRC 11914]|uniref:TatD family hydrolase n=1 Tax=Actinomycetospora sp. TBRC 11914 TaxID=2729387 RepID=UPI00145F0ECD|nr:TatD family hydrolase [Actinomycetospora sp. TBRC 11914]NMO92570.1 TatD family hydrolase [Actinomycetospora sp. TBRC 11914]
MGSKHAVPPPVPEPIPGGVVDSHTHLDACGATDPDILAAVLDRATTAGVTAMVTTADDLVSARWAADTAGKDPRVFAAVGLHPTRSRDLDDAARAEIEALAARPRVVAIGESGLDDYWTTRRDDCAPLDVQREAFAWHIDLARRTGLPLVVHDRDAHDAIVDVLRAEGAPGTVVFHCFSGGPDLARVCADEGWLMSFSGTATFRNANAAELRRAAAEAPEDLVLTETDAPFLTPHPYRGRPNEPYCVPHTVRDLAELRDQPVDELAAAATRNAQRTFRLAEQPQP